MNLCRINGRTYDVMVTGIERNFNILYSDNTGRTMGSGAPMTLDPLGTFYGHKVTFERKADNFAEFDLLWTTLSKPSVSGLKVECVYGQSTISYQAYVSSGSQELAKVGKDNNVYWNTLEVSFTPLKAQVTS